MEHVQQHHGSPKPVLKLRKLRVKSVLRTRQEVLSFPIQLWIALFEAGRGVDRYCEIDKEDVKVKWIYKRKTMVIYRC